MRNISKVNFKHPTLTIDEMKNGCRLGIDTWADTSCAGKHAYIEAFIEGRMVTATGFSASLGQLDNLSIVQALYAYDLPNGEVLLLENNQAIYMGENMTDSLLNPIQCEDNGVHVDTRPSKFYPSLGSKCQCITFDDDFTIPIEYDGVLPYLPVRRPTPEEIDECERRSLTSAHNWDPHNHELSSIMPITNKLYFVSADPIDDYFQCKHLDKELHSVKIMNSTLVNNNEIYATTFTSKSSITPEELSKKWFIGLKTAERTLKATTYKCIRTTGLLSKRFKTDKAQLRYNQLSRHNGTFYVDYLKNSVKSLRGNIGGSIYTNKFGFKKFFPHEDEKGKSTAYGLRQFIDMVGLPSAIHSDGHNNFTEGEYKKLIRKFNLPHTTTEPHSPWQNRAEHAIDELKQYARRMMSTTNTPIRCWCFCYEYCCDILSLCATGRYSQRGRTPYELITNYTPDISELVTFTWFQWCYYFDEGTRTKHIARWLGPAYGIGQAFCSYLLLGNGEYITRSSVIPIPEGELATDLVKEQCNKFMQSVEAKIGDATLPQYNPSVPNQLLYTSWGDDYIDETYTPCGTEIAEAMPAEVDLPYLEHLDEYIGTNVVIPGTTPDVEPVIAIIKGRKRNHNGDLIGKEHPNPVLDTRVYNLEFPDGRVEEYGMNTILENLMAQVDSDGYDLGIFQEIVDVRRDENLAIPRGNNGFTYVSGRKKPVITTKGWEFLIKWKDNSTTWVPLSTVKESFPVQCAEFVTARQLQEEPAFKWWVPHTFRKRESILAYTKSYRHHRKGRMKYGVLIPSTVQQAIEYDTANGNTLWQDAIKKEMENNRIAFELLQRGEMPPPGYKKIRCHMNFEVKMDLRRKARYVAGGHLTDPPTTMTYSTVVSRESVRIAFLIAALNNLEILAGDIQNAYLNAPTEEKLYFVAGDEWGPDKGRLVVIVRALYGLKSSALAWRNHLSDTLANVLKFKSSLADPDVWYKPMVDKAGNEYYAYILIYVDDMLIIDKEPKILMDQVKDNYNVRDSTIKEPDQYLGADIKKIHYNDGTHAWTMASESYVKNAVKNIKERMKDSGFKFNSRLSDVKYSPKQPFSNTEYRPEIDTSSHCNEEQTQFFQNILGVLRWLVELGRIDIAFETTALASYLAMPRTGHLLQALHMIKYIEIHSSNEITFDPQELYISPEDMNLANDKREAMNKLYVDAEETLPTNAPPPRGKPVQINCFVDSDHAGDRVTRRSHTGILMYLNKAPIMWYSKKQSTVESSTFGSEFVALRVACEQIISLRYKLRMFGIPISGFANVFCDNESVFKNSSLAESRLTKKHNSVCFHRVRECVANGTLMTFKVGTDFNLADILTKSLPNFKRKRMREMIMPMHN